VPRFDPARLAPFYLAVPTISTWRAPAIGSATGRMALTLLIDALSARRSRRHGLKYRASGLTSRISGDPLYPITAGGDDRGRIGAEWAGSLGRDMMPEGSAEG
jgi:hypothetical protein